VRATHERWDGRGYPDGLAGEEIPLGARIIAACDAYDAMTTDRCYRRAIDHQHACEELRREAGHQFDRAVTDALLNELGLSAPAAEQEGEHDPSAEEVMSYLREMLARHAIASVQ
jgi:HD-GYP domain-containing protein (c-di-GMP phosphodiesterase class II)